MTLRPLPAAVALATALAFLSAGGATGQVVSGRILEEGTDFPVGGAGVFLLDGAKKRVVQTMADSEGLYALTIPAHGEYYLFVERIGYAALFSPLLEIGVVRDHTLDLVVRRAPIALAPIEVTVDRRRAEYLMNRLIGMNVGAMGGKLLMGDDLEALKSPGRDLVDVLRFGGLPGQITKGIQEFCFRTRGRCADVYLDGIRIPMDFVETIAAEAVTAVLVLRSYDATTIMGTRDTSAGQGGTLMIFTGAYNGR